MQALRQTLWKPSGYFRRIPTGRFNRLCLAFSFLWLAVALPLSLVWRPTLPDFGQFYVAGHLARRGEWGALYPVPKRYSLDNAGLWLHSDAKPRWKKMSAALGVGDYTHFILPPPSALLFAPLSFLSFRRAYWAWIAFSSACVWCLALVAGRLLRRILRKPSPYEGALAVLIALSPMTARAIRIANVSPPIALALGVALLALVRRDQAARAAGAILAGALLKYATLVLAPVLVAMRRWKTLFACLAGGLLLLVASVLLMGTAPFAEFATVILPTLSRTSWFPGNQSLPGLLARVYGRPLGRDVALGLSFLRFMTLEGVLALLFFRRPARWRNPVNVLAAAALLLRWLLIFSPIAWEHWPIFLCPVWGWLLWESREPGLARLTAVAALALMYLPAGIIQVGGVATYPVVFPEPFNSSQLLGVALVFALAARRLLRRPPGFDAGASGEPEREELGKGRRSRRELKVRSRSPA